MTAQDTSAPLRDRVAALQAGMVVGRHRVEGKLREGGMAIIYLGEHVETGARVAIKVLRAEYADDPELVARFDREAQVMGRLAGMPNIVQVHDMGTLEDGRRYLVTEFVRGEDLDDVLEHHRNADESFDILRACRLARDVARGLDSAHRREIVHRDLKPSNIMIEQRRGSEEKAKVLDFGVSADLGEIGQEQALTTAGSVIGTPQYMAPEQAAGIKASASFDLYALGVVLWEMLSGQLPPPHGWRAGGLPDIVALRKGLPPALVDLVRGCLEHDSTRRIESAAEVVRKLDEIISEAHGTAGKMKQWAINRPAAAAGQVRSTPGPMTPPRQPAVIVDGPNAVAAGKSSQDGGLAARAKAGAGGRVGSAPGRASSGSHRVLLVGMVALFAFGAAATYGLLRNRTGDESTNVRTETLGAGLDARTTMEREEPSVGEPAALHEAVADVQPADQPRGEATDAALAEHGDPAADSAGDPPDAPSQDAGATVPEAEASDARPEPQPEPKPERNATKPSQRPDSPPSKPSAAEAKAQQCEATIAEAKQAATRGKWATVLRQTRNAECWTGANRAERTRLRTQALFETEQYAQCAAAGKGSTDRNVARWAGICEKRAQEAAP